MKAAIAKSTSKPADDPILSYEEFIRGYTSARKAGNAVLKHDFQSKLFSLVETGFYDSHIDFTTFGVMAEQGQVGVLGAAKNETTHEFSAIIIQNEMCVPVSLLNFLRVEDQLKLRRKAPPAEIFGQHLSVVADGGRLGKYRHAASKPDQQREYLRLGSIQSMSRGASMALCHEIGFPVGIGFRIRDEYNERGFSTPIKREGLRGMRFVCETPMSASEVLGALRSMA